MLVRSLALGAVASLALAAGAQAEGWGGWYIGLHAGTGSSETDTTRTITDNVYFGATNLTAVENASRKSLDEQTFAGGAGLGVNWPLSPHFLIGAEVDASGYGNDTSATAAAIPYPGNPASNFTVTNSVEQTWLATARLRVGISTSWFMAYATGGYAGADIKFTQTFADTFTPIATQTLENSEFRSGYSLGGGVEVMIESGASLKVEYMRYDLGEIATTGRIGLGTTTSNGLADVTNDVWRIGMNFQMD